MKLLIKYPSKGRPNQFISTLNQYISLAEKLEDITFLITLDIDDEYYEEYRKKIAFLENKVKVNIVVGSGLSPNKVYACNRDMDCYDDDWDILILASDDMIPDRLWDWQIKYQYASNRTNIDPLALWFRDGYQDRTCTQVICNRAYYEKFKYLYHPSYKSLWCDNEYTEVGLTNGELKKIQQCIIKHEHPDNNKELRTDTMYEKNRKCWRADKWNYKFRKLLNFPK